MCGVVLFVPGCQVHLEGKFGGTANPELIPDPDICFLICDLFLVRSAGIGATGGKLSTFTNGHFDPVSAVPFVACTGLMFTKKIFEIFFGGW